MDVNGTLFHLVLGETDWLGTSPASEDAGWCWSRQRNVIQLKPRPFTFPPRAGDVELTPNHRRGAGRDCFGNWYWIDATRHQIRFLSARGTEATTYWPTASKPGRERTGGGFSPSQETLPTDLTLSGLAITEDQYLVVGALDLPSEEGTTSGLLVFDLHSGGSPVPVAWPRELDFSPFDMAAVPGGGVAILDNPAPDGPGPARYWMLDRYLRVCDLGAVASDDPPSPVFAPSGSDPETVRLGAELPSMIPTSPDQAAIVSSGGSVPEPGASWAIAIEVLPDRSVLILDREASDGRLAIFGFVERVGEPLDLGIGGAPGEGGTSFPGLCTEQRSIAEEIFDAVKGHDMAFVSSEVGASTLFIVDAQGDQAFAFRYEDGRAMLQPEYYPLRLFSGRALVGGPEIAHYDMEERWFPVANRSRPRFGAEAEILLPPDSDGDDGYFDGLEPQTVWHRLCLDASIPPGTSVTVESRTADDPVVLERQPWQREPGPYLRGDSSEIPYHSYAPTGSSPGEGTWELLFQSAVGRYLQLRLMLRGDGRHTPRLWAARIHFPRFSYLEHYLPDVYQEDAGSASFLDRFLANVEGSYTTIEGRIAAAQLLLDPKATDPAYLGWLASWVGGVVDQTWDAARRRLFVRYAARLFTRRGTRRGLIEAIRLATDECVGDFIFEPESSSESPFAVRIVEQFRTRTAPGVVFGDPTDLQGPRLIVTGDRWTLADGKTRLQELYERFLADRYPTHESEPLGDAVAAAWQDESLTADEALTFPALTPNNKARRADWLDFVRGRLDVNYATVGTDDDRDAYRAYLSQRYRRIADLHAAWGLQGAARPPTLGAIELPVALPADGAALQDWIQFVSTVLPVQRNSHRFSVLVPIRLEDSDAVRDQKLGMVERVVAADRPGHTAFDVKPYWGALRVGEARVGYETIVGEGSRYVEMVLGVKRLAYGYLPGGRTWHIDDRLVLDRDRISTTGAAVAGSLEMEGES